MATMVSGLSIAPVPDISWTGDGQEFDAARDFWRFPSSVRSYRGDFNDIRPHVTADFTARYRRRVKTMFCTQNIDSALIVHRRLVNLLHDLSDDRRPLDLIEAEDVAAYLSRIYLGYAAQLRMIRRKARAIRSPLFSADGLDFLERVFVPDTSDQEAVLRWDPVAGPYRPSEDKALKAAIDAAFNDGRIALCDYSLIRCSRASAHDPPRSPR